MNCEIAREKIYKLVYTDTKELDEELIRHINDCPDCNSYYEECRSAKELTSLLSQKQAVLNNPKKLTNDILDSIQEFEPEKKSTGINISITAKRFLAAASVCLMIVFGYEQYVVMEKMIKLEEQMSVVTNAPINSSYYLKMLRNFPEKGVELIKSQLATMGMEPHDEALKSLFRKANFGVLSRDAISKRFQNQLSHLKISEKDMGLIISILEKE